MPARRTCRLDPGTPSWPQVQGPGLPRRRLQHAEPVVDRGALLPHPRLLRHAPRQQGRLREVGPGAAHQALGHSATGAFPANSPALRVSFHKPLRRAVLLLGVGASPSIDELLIRSFRFVPSVLTGHPQRARLPPARVRGPSHVQRAAEQRRTEPVPHVPGREPRKFGEM